MLLPLFTFQVTDVEESKLKEITFKNADGKSEKLNAKVKTITLAELPYTDLLNMRKIHESTLIWYTAPEATVP